MRADEIDKPLCALCGRPLDDGPTDRDHVFGQAFGGRATVASHRACNNELGHSAEGRLHRPNTLMSLVRAARGLPAPEVRGATADGTRTNLDLVTGRPREARPTVEVSQVGDRVELSARGAEEYLRGVLKDWRRKYGDVVPTWDDLPPEARSELLSAPTDVNISISHDLNDANGFAVKAALGAGILVYGPGFAASDVAQALRDCQVAVNSGVHEGGLEMSVEALAVMNEKFAAQADGYEASGLSRPQLPSLADSGGGSDVIFVPFGNKTAVFVRVLGVPVTNGIIVDAALPSSELGAAAAPVLRETGGELLIVDYTKRLLDPVAQYAEAQAIGLDESSDE